MIAFIAGILIYPLVEYVIHRWILHGLKIKGHQRHHACAATGQAAELSLAAVGFCVIVGIALGPFWPAAIGIFVGFLGFLAVHHIVHHKGNSLPRLRRHHAIHHHVSARYNYGIVTTFWDRVFGTYRKKEPHRI